MSNSKGLGAAIAPSCLADPISFYAVADGLYYRHAGGRVFRIVLDRERIAAANDSDAEDEATLAAEVDSDAGFREVPPDVIAHTLARPLALWQLDAELGMTKADAERDFMQQGTNELADLARDLADEIDLHVDACPLAALAPAEVREPALQLTCDLAITVLAATEPATIPVLATALRGRGVVVDHEGKLRAKLLGLEEIDEVARGGVADGLEAPWACTDLGRARAIRVRAALLALAD